MTPLMLAVAGMALKLDESGADATDILAQVGVIAAAGLVVAAIGGLSAAVALASPTIQAAPSRPPTDDASAATPSAAPIGTTSAWPKPGR